MSKLKITSKTKLYVLIGDPVEHSLSPVMQNAAFEIMGVDAVYLALRVQTSMLFRVIDCLRVLNISGFNVTIPHKVSIIKCLDEMNEKASAIGAANTVVNRDGKLIGYNTDGTGALAALRDAGVDPSGKRVLLLGAGGAARALAFSLVEVAERVIVLNRTALKAESLVKDVRRSTRREILYGELNSSTLEKEVPDSDLLENATSVGMDPIQDKTPVDAKLLGPNLVVFDIVYGPHETRLLKDAKAAGAKRVNGLGMLAHQGAQAFEIWTGMEAPVATMTGALKEALGVSSDEN
ncbi:shikimate dehydrogenase [Candidatus Bathyarchaeota archaeon]|nr:shikimate dehydrogenase [Candidatus Bathyarchaeota archaeon]